MPIKIKTEKIKGTTNNQKEYSIKSITGAPAPTELPPEYVRGGIWVQLKEETLEIHIPTQATKYLRIGDSIAQTEYETIKRLIHYASKRFDELSALHLKKHAPWNGEGTETI